MKKSLVCTILVLFILSGALLWSQNWQVVATLGNDADSGETLLNLNWICQGTAGQEVLIESRDGQVTEAGVIRHIYGNFITLEERLQNDFLIGSRVHQGSAFVQCDNQ